MKTARTEVLALLFGALLGIGLVACATRPRSGAQMPVSRDTDAGAGSSDIATLDQQIAHDLAQLGIDAPTDAEVTSAMVGHQAPPIPMSSGGIAETCPTPPSDDSCSDICTLADSICGNASKICRLADDLGDDPYAAQRCTAGKLSCDRASARCCGCP